MPIHKSNDYKLSAVKNMQNEHQPERVNLKNIWIKSAF